MTKDSASLDEFREPDPGSGYPGALKMDPNEWLPYMAEFDLSEEEKTELLQTLWDIMMFFAYRGWGVDRVYHAIPALAEFNEQSNLNKAAQEKAPQKDENEHDLP